MTAKPLNDSTIQPNHPSLHIVIVGHVDHGKSTLIGRLFYDTGCLPQEKIDEIKSSMGGEMEFAHVMDHFEEERSRGITIDTAQTFFKTDKRKYIIIDAPGHKEFLKNMITGSSQAEAALLLVDAAEGIKEQTRRHCFILNMLGLKQITVLINKMDLVGNSEEKFNEISKEIKQLLNNLDIQPSYIIPISAKNGDNVAMEPEHFKWYNGPTVLQSLDNFTNLEVNDKGLRFPVQDVYSIEGEELVVGRIESGQMSVGEDLLILPDMEQTRVLSIKKYQDENITTSKAGECIGIRIDEKVVRGQVLIPSSNHASAARNKEPRTTQKIHANIFWMSNKPYDRGCPITFKCATQEIPGRINKIYKCFDPATVEVVESDASRIKAAEIAEVEIDLEKPVVVDQFAEIPEMGRFVLEETDHPVAGGIIL